MLISAFTSTDNESSTREVEVILAREDDQGAVEALGFPLIIDLRDHNQIRVLIQVDTTISTATLNAKLPGDAIVRDVSFIDARPDTVGTRG